MICLNLLLKEPHCIERRKISNQLSKFHYIKKKQSLLGMEVKTNFQKMKNEKEIFANDVVLLAKMPKGFFCGA